MVRLLGSFNLLSLSLIIDNDINIEPVNHTCLHRYINHCQSIATVSLVDGWLVLNVVQDMTEYTDIDNDRWMRTVKITGHESRYDAEMLLIQYSHLTHIYIKALKILQKITNALRMMAKCNG